jgi:peptide/nickel transport system permease protein
VRYIRRKLVQLVLVLVAVSAATYLLINLLPGDPTLAILGPSATKEAQEALRADLNLDDPLPVRYGKWVGGALRGDLGQSYITRQPVAQAIGERLPLTIELMLMAEVLALVVAVPLGIIAGARPNGWVDRLGSAVTFGLLSVPNFMLGVVLIYVLAVRWHVFGATGIDRWFAIGRGQVATPRSIFLPALTLAVGQMAVAMRLLRSDLIATLQQDYIQMARAMGLPNRRILLRHALRPSTFSLITVIGLNMGALIGGSFIVENLFALPGLGRLIVTSIYKRDYLIVQGGVLVVAVGYVVINFVVDLLYAVLDPRVRDARALA